MTVERCGVCEKTIFDDDAMYCSCCTDPVCEDCVRVPDDDHQIDPMDYCLPCYILEGYGELWHVNYLTHQGDVFPMIFDTEVNTCSFKIPKYARLMSGTLYRKVANYHKIKDKSKILDYVNSHIGGGR